MPDIGQRNAIHWKQTTASRPGCARHWSTVRQDHPTGRTRISLHDFPSIPNPRDRRHKQPTDGNLNVSSLEVGQHTGA